MGGRFVSAGFPAGEVGRVGCVGSGGMWLLQSAKDVGGPVRGCCETSAVLGVVSGGLSGNLIECLPFCARVSLVGGGFCMFVAVS